MRACCWCLNYNSISWLCRTTERDVSGNKCWYRKWSKHRCMLKQEDKYPRNCDFKEDIERVRMVKIRMRMHDKAVMSAKL